MRKRQFALISTIVVSLASATAPSVGDGFWDNLVLLDGLRWIWD